MLYLKYICIQYAHIVIMKLHVYDKVLINIDHFIHFYAVLPVITLLVASVTSQTIEFDPSLNDTIYIDLEVCIYVCMLFFIFV